CGGGGTTTISGWSCARTSSAAASPRWATSASRHPTTRCSSSAGALQITAPAEERERRLPLIGRVRQGDDAQPRPREVLLVPVRVGSDVGPVSHVQVRIGIGVVSGGDAVGAPGAYLLLTEVHGEVE